MEKAFYVVNCGARKVDAKKVNIDGSDDVFYRYKCPQLLIQVLGKGKMIKTVLLNNDDFARGVHLMPEYVPAYLGYEIGAQFKYENKKPERERAHISGEYTTLELSDVIKKLIREIVLCRNCKLPELKMSCETKRKLIFLTCASCGNREELKKCNPKFLKFITNNPPGDVGGVEAKKAPQARIQKKKETPEDSKEKEKEEKEDGGSGEDSPEEEVADKEAQNGAVLEIDQEDIARTENDLKRAAEQGIEWQSDMSKEAIANRRAELVPEAIKQLVSDSSSIDRLKSLLETSPSDDVIVSNLSSLKIEAEDSVETLFNYVFQKDYVKDAKAHSKLLKSLLSSESGQIAFLVQLESSLLEKGDVFIKKSATYIKSFYDQDLIEEQSILKWYALAAEDNRVRKASKALVDWLQTAEEESDDDE